MALGDILKGAAGIYLDAYEKESKRRGNADGINSARVLKDYMNGKIDMNGNPINDSDDDEWGENMATGYVCSYCKKCSGTTVSVFGGKRTEKPAMSTRNCPASPNGNHKWVKK